MNEHISIKFHWDLIWKGYSCVTTFILDVAIASDVPVFTLIPGPSPSNFVASNAPPHIHPPVMGEGSMYT